MTKTINIIKNNWLLLPLLALQIPLILPFLRPGFFPTHDDVQVVRIFEMFQSIKFGDFPPRWSSGLLYGHGYPLYVFYSPLTYILGALFAFIGLNFLLSTKAIFIIGFVLGAISFYFLAKELFGKLPAFFSTVIYSLAPYRAVDVYVRGNLAEFFALSLFPIVFFLNIKLLKNPKNKAYVLLLSISATLLILTHNVSTFIFATFLLIFNLLFLLKYRFKAKLFLPILLSSSLISLGLSCFYWLPLLVERQFVKLDKFASFPYQKYFLSLKQIWDSPWGYGGFIETNPMSLELGKTIIISSLLALLLNIFIKTKKNNLINFLALSLVLFTFLETYHSRILWDRLSVIHYMQFPWRYHILTSVIGPLLFAAFSFLLKKSIKLKLLVLPILFISSLLAFKDNFPYFKPQRYSNDPPVSETTTWDDEYMPVWVKIKPQKYEGDKVKIVKGNALISNLSWGYLSKAFRINSESESTIQLAHVYYPGWNAYVDGKKVNINYQNDQGLMQISINPGNHYVNFSFQRTWWRLISELVSIITLFIILKPWVFFHRQHSKSLLKNNPPQN
ncbi:MAG: 6-pyruvoyl-tetrahydropterin synthase-related protein [Patescibacteria group bacterium]|jgi:4-amino-4-deoxy-L-arabinose transferase-like glycosyltransferase